MYVSKITLIFIAFLTIHNGFAVAECEQTDESPDCRYGSVKIISEYYKFEDKTTQELEEMSVGDRLKVKVSFTYDGTVIENKPKTVDLIFISNRNRSGYADSNPLILIIDDKDRINIGNLERYASILNGITVEVLELMQASIPLETFIRIANSQKVEGRLLQTTFSFNESQINSLRALLNRIPLE